MQKLKRGIAILCTIALMISMLPIQASAVSKACFVKVYSNLYENSTAKGVYTFKVKNLVKGQTVKWSVTGEGKSYVKLKKTSIKATGTTVSNTITVDTKGALAAKNKTLHIVAKVYSTQGKLLKTIDAGQSKIKIKPKEIQTLADETEDLLVGNSYQFDAEITPSNANGTKSWVVTDENGKDAKSYMTKEGIFTPMEDGIYYISAKIVEGISTTLISEPVKVTVLPTLQEVKQTAVNQVTLKYTGSVVGVKKLENFTITTVNGAAIPIKSMAYSETGKEVILTTYSNFIDKEKYKVADDVKSFSMTASVGRPVYLNVLTTTATVNRATKIEYAVYDANNIDVTSLYPGTITFEQLKITNGVLDEKECQIYMTNIGDIGIFTMNYTCLSDETIKLSTIGTVTCVSLGTSLNTNFTLTETEQKPDYSKEDYVDNRSVSAGNNYFVYFRALDTDKTEIAYDSITYESSNPDVLLINQRADGTVRATAIKTGTVKVYVNATYHKQSYTYSYDVTVVEAPILNSIVAERYGVTLSSRMMYGYQEVIPVTAYDQYGKVYPLTNETAQITFIGEAVNGFVSYDATENSIIIKPYGVKAGTYYVTVTIIVLDKKIPISLTINVLTPPEKGEITYKVELSRQTVDLAISADVDLTKSIEDKKITVRLAEYHDGIFYNYIYFNSAVITKDGLYYTSDLTKAGVTTEVNGGFGTSVTLTPMKLGNDTLIKASTGVYNIELRYYVSGKINTIRESFRIDDTMSAPKVTVVRTTADKSCKTALELAQNCLSVNGTFETMITECTLTGSSKMGSAYTLEKGESVNIKSVTVRETITLSSGEHITIDHTIAIGKTLKNM